MLKGFRALALMGCMVLLAGSPADAYRKAHIPGAVNLGFVGHVLRDASWLGYGNTFDAPAESVTYFNVAGVSERMRALESRIEQLEKALAATKGK